MSSPVSRPAAPAAEPMSVASPQKTGYKGHERIISWSINQEVYQPPASHTKNALSVTSVASSVFSDGSQLPLRDSSGSSSNDRTVESEITEYALKRRRKIVRAVAKFTVGLPILVVGTVVHAPYALKTKLFKPEIVTVPERIEELKAIIANLKHEIKIKEDPLEEKRRLFRVEALKPNERYHDLIELCEKKNAEIESLEAEIRIAKNDGNLAKLAELKKKHSKAKNELESLKAEKKAIYTPVLLASEKEIVFQPRTGNIVRTNKDSLKEAQEELAKKLDVRPDLPKKRKFKSWLEKNCTLPGGIRTIQQAMQLKKTILVKKEQEVATKTTPDLRLESRIKNAAPIYSQVVKFYRSRNSLNSYC